jgi:hypothetical protein
VVAYLFVRCLLHEKRRGCCLLVWVVFFLSCRGERGRGRKVYDENG